MKFLTIIFNTHMNPFVSMNQLISECEYGFRKNYPLEYELKDIIYIICEAFNDKKVLCIHIIFFFFNLLTHQKVIRKRF